MVRLPLEGIRVTDFSWIINGPQTGLWLAAMGAEVIKIESRVYLDFMRLNPAFMADGQADVNRNGGYHTLNYGKKSINLNIKTPRGKELAYELVTTLLSETTNNDACEVVVREKSAHHENLPFGAIVIDATVEDELT